MIEQIKVGVLKTNCYIIYDENEAIIIDPGSCDKRITSFIDENRLKVKLIYLTHCHFDHIVGAMWLKEIYNVPIGCIDKELDNINDVNINFSLKMTGKGIAFLCDKVFFENDEMNVGRLNFRVIHTPGHTSGGSCLYGESMLISGDTLFSDCFGRCDLPTGNMGQIVKSVNEKLYTLPKDTTVYPGHGEITTIGERILKEDEF